MMTFRPGAIAFAALMMMPAAAHAEPVYLSCDFGAASGQYPVELVANEAESSVNLTVPKTGHNERFRALFSKDTVVFGNDLSQYTVSRVTLGMTIVTPVIQKTSVGQCVVDQKPKRAF